MQQFLHVGEYHIVLMFHVVLDLHGIVIIEFEYQEGHVIDVIAVEGLYELAAYARQYEFAEIGVCTLKVVNQCRE